MGFRPVNQAFLEFRVCRRLQRGPPDTTNRPPDLNDDMERMVSLDPETFDALIDTVRRFVAERLRPLEGAVEEADAIPADLVQEMREMGLFGLSIAEEYGGLGLTMSEEARIAIEFGRTTPAFRSTFGTNVGIGSQGLVMAGSPEQKAAWLPGIASGEIITSFALT